ncbi:hypothetical protein FDF26_04130 [Clostridium botulinum]|nr:hypothetical protein [Clostridium botulinum]
MEYTYDKNGNSYPTKPTLRHKMEGGDYIRKKFIIIFFSILILLLIFLNFYYKTTNLNELIVQNYDIQGVDSLKCNSSSDDFESFIDDKEKINEFFNFFSTVKVKEYNNALSKDSKGFLLIKFYQKKTLVFSIFIFDENNIAIMNLSNDSIKYYKVKNLKLNFDFIKNSYLQ